jgi:hypothetical protein
VSKSFPPAETQPSKLEQAKERLHDLFVDADMLRHQAHEASAALEAGSLVLAEQLLTEAEKTAGILPARTKWASHAVESAKAEAIP